MTTWASRAKVHFLEKRPNPTDKTDERVVLSVLSVPPDGFCKKIDWVSSVLSVPTGGNPEKKHSDADTPPGNPDRWCWPLSSAMNGSEIALFGKRVDLFFYRDLLLPEAEKLADQLVIRDRDADTRRACFECAHLRDMGHGWRCNNYRTAGLTTRELGRDFAGQLQHCNGFAEAEL